MDSGNEDDDVQSCYHSAESGGEEEEDVESEWDAASETSLVHAGSSALDRSSQSDALVMPQQYQLQHQLPASSSPTFSSSPSTPPTPLHSQSDSPSYLTVASFRSAADIPPSKPPKKPATRYSLPSPVPAIPAHFLQKGVPALVPSSAHSHDDSNYNIAPTHDLRSFAALKTSPRAVKRPATSGLEGLKVPQTPSSLRRTPSPASRSEHGLTRTTRSHTSNNARSLSACASELRRKSQSAVSGKLQLNEDTLSILDGASHHEAKAKMSSSTLARNEDLFLELANAEETARPPSRRERNSGRLSLSAKRRSLPPETIALMSQERQGSAVDVLNGSRPVPRLDPVQRHLERRQVTPGRAPNHAYEVANTATTPRSHRPHRYSAILDRALPSSSQFVDSITSPEAASFSRRPSSLASTPHNRVQNKVPESQSESPIDSSEPKQSVHDSASVDSQTNASTVWDELDDLKSRIKKLELTGKIPSTSGAVVSGESSERPRTATTAPTTIESSPKHDRATERKPEPDAVRVQTADKPVAGTATTNIHPLLHSALAKAKPLLSSRLYRQLETTATDALQLAAMTGVSGPQGTAYAAASIINGVTGSDRQVRRKADTMCRNLTDLTLALCEGKHETPSPLPSSLSLDHTVKSSPTLRYSRSNVSRLNDDLKSQPGRPMSRLEARRTSFLGPQATNSLGTSPRESGEELSASEHESTPQNLTIPDARRFSRTSSRLRVGIPKYEDISGDEDLTVRPLSRARSDAGRIRSRPAGSRDFHASQSQRSPSFREALVARRAANMGISHHQDDAASASAQLHSSSLAPVASLSSDSAARRRFLQDHPSTPPVIEENSPVDSDTLYDECDVPGSHPHKRRINSHGPLPLSQRLANVATAADNRPVRATSLSQSRHHVAVE